MVDEAHVLLSGGNVLGADFLAQIQRRARKYNTGNIIITQQPSDFTSQAVITQGKAIFDNASYYLVLSFLSLSCKKKKRTCLKFCKDTLYLSCRQNPINRKSNMKKTPLLSLLGIFALSSSLSAQVRSEFLLEKGWKAVEMIWMIMLLK